MKTYSECLAQYRIWTKNSAAANDTFGTTEANDFYRKICALKDWPFLEQLRIVTTTAATQATALPYDTDIVREISVTPTGQTKRYTPEIVRNARYWDELNLSLFSSDIPQYVYVFSGSVYLWPTPVSSGNSIRVTQKTRVIDQNIADITSSTITTATNGSTTMVLSGGLTSNMVGMWIRPTYTGAANTGDGNAYQIAGVTNSTTCTLTRAYGGSSISGGTAACTIGQVSLLPEALQLTPWRAAAAKYWETNTDPRGASFRSEVADDLKLLGVAYSNQTTDMVIDSGEINEIINPNLTVTL